MKIGIVCYPTYGGSGIIATELAKHLSEYHTVHLFSYCTPVRLKSTNKNLLFHKINLDSYPLFPSPLYTFNLTATLYQAIKEYNLDILHLHYGLPHAIAGYVVKNMHNKKVPKFIITLHGTDVYNLSENGKRRELLQFCLSNSDSVTVVSNYLLNEVQKKFNIPNIKRIYNFVDTDQFKPIWKYPTPPSKTLYCKDSEYLLVHISNFRPLKQVPQLIYAFKLIVECIPARLLLIGSGPQLQEAKNTAHELCLTKYVEFLGETDNIEEVLSVSDLFMLSARVESFSLAALEALSCATPVVGYAVGGLPEVVKDGICGKLVVPNEPKLLAEAALALLTKPALLHQFSLNARQVAKSFNAKKIIKEYEQHYNLLLTEGIETIPKSYDRSTTG